MKQPTVIVILSSDSEADTCPTPRTSKMKKKSRQGAGGHQSSSSSGSGSAPGPIVLSDSDSDSDSQQPPKKVSRENWQFFDQVKILKALADHRRAGRELPKAKELFGELQGKLRRQSFTPKDLGSKIEHLRERFVSELYMPPAARHRQYDSMLFNLSNEVWPELLPDSQPQ
uniref:Glabrous enhancer-binding protein-like DBD domain-containing protein n=1 Tax=Leersia perrieri TaxID=77586 RepID=A0A0D9XH67_9ORYZ